VSLSQMGSYDILKTQYLADKECGFIKLCVLTTSKNQPLNAVCLDRFKFREVAWYLCNKDVHLLYFSHHQAMWSDRI
jgi:hypothetical protein